jgi:UDP-N-acetylglucosamine transferase subunit ALG13
MIFLIVGTQEAFDRLVRTVDNWAGENKIKDVFAQIANSKYKPRNMKSESFIEPSRFNLLFNKADLIIAHAGMGTILKSLENNKPIIVMPRIAELKEHRNNHQMATVKSLLKLNYLNVAFNEKELTAMLNNIDNIKSLVQITPFASEQLTKAVCAFLNS